MNKSKNYINIQGWMTSELQLKSNELILYAIIYGFSQDDKSEFYGSLSYIQKMLNISRPTVTKTLKSLIKKGFVIRTNESRYKAVTETINGRIMNQSKTYINIQGWMISDLQLKSNELILYAIIYGFSQDGRSEFYGSLSYTQKMLNVYKNTVIKSLKSLTQKGFVIRTNESRYKAVIMTDGKVNPLSGENEQGGCKNFTSKENEPSKENEQGGCKNFTSTSKENEPLASKENEHNKNNTNNTNTKYNNTYTHTQKKEKFSALNFLKSKLNLDTELLQEVLSIRKKRKAENTERALTHFCEQIKKANMQSDDTIKNIIEFYLGEVAWQGFRSEWYMKYSNEYIQEPQKQAKQGQQGLQHLPKFEQQRIKKLIEANK